MSVMICLSCDGVIDTDFDDFNFVTQQCFECISLDERIIRNKQINHDNMKPEDIPYPKRASEEQHEIMMINERTKSGK